MLSISAAHAAKIVCVCVFVCVCELVGVASSYSRPVMNGGQLPTNQLHDIDWGALDPCILCTPISVM